MRYNTWNSLLYLLTEHLEFGYKDPHASDWFSFWLIDLDFDFKKSEGHWTHTVTKTHEIAPSTVLNSTLIQTCVL